MPFELLSGILGSTAAEIVSKIAPARTGGEFSDIPSETLRQRNRWLYRCMWGGFCLGFSAPLLALAVGSESAPWRNEWLSGVIFGLPFTNMFAFLGFIWAAPGSKRTREFLFYFERQQRTHIYVLYLFGLPLSVLGLISSIFLWR